MLVAHVIIFVCRHGVLGRWLVEGKKILALFLRLDSFYRFFAKRCIQLDLKRVKKATGCQDEGASNTEEGGEGLHEFRKFRFQFRKGKLNLEQY